MKINQELEDAKREAETWKKRFWDLKNLNTQLRDYEISQAQADVMRSFIYFIDKVRNWSTCDIVSGDCLYEIVNLADRDLERFNIQVVGHPYELLTENHEFFQFDGDHNNEPFTVIHSAYANNNEPWIKGFARSTQTKGE